MIICKQPEIGGKGDTTYFAKNSSDKATLVPEHNDSTFLVCSLFKIRQNLILFKYTSPPSALGFWFALEPCTASNGALSFLPGSHFTTGITKRFVRLPEGGTGFEVVRNVEKPLGLDKVESIEQGSSDYVLETCGSGESMSISRY
jgi:ectoine hydroxylase-related dioxygenase (phytanoyl-CoA dioxygenase family)